MFSSLISLLFVSFLVSQNESTSAAAGKIEIQGDKGVEIFGLCFNSKGEQIRKIEGDLPYESSVSLDWQRCEVKTKAGESKSPVQIKLFQRNQMIYSNSFQTPTIGIEFVIPWK